jgi:hypothetical protein
MQPLLPNLNGSFHPRLAFYLAVSLASLALRALAQPETFEGNPDSSAFIRIPKDTDDWTRHFRLGALVGMNISANFGMSGSAFGISGNNPQQGNFADGYVRTDQTGNAGGYTGYWGYNNASQYNAAAQTLTFHAITSFSTATPTAGNASENGGPFPGIDMAYGGNLWYWKHARVGWDLGLSWLPVNITDNHPIGVTANQFAYTYNVGNIVVPGAPYQGGPSGQGEPLIPGTWSKSQQLNPISGMVNGTRTLDVSLYTMRFGPSFYWDLTQRYSMSLGAGPAFGVVNGDYKFDETVNGNGFSVHNTGTISATELTWGGYVNATLMYHTSENADIYIGAQFMPMTDATISGGGRECQLNLGGQLYFSIGINWAF